MRPQRNAPACGNLPPVLARLEDSRPARRALLLILLVGLCLRLGWALMQPSDPAALRSLPDQQEYVELAAAIAQGHTMSFHDDRFGERVYAYRTPGYPAFLAITGPHVGVARVGQAIVDTSTILAAYLLARRWLGRRASLLAATLVAVNPFLVYFSGLLLSETLYTALLAWAAVGLAYESRRWWIGHVGALLLAVGTVARPSSLFLVVLLPLLTPALGWRARGSLIFTAIVGAMLLLAPWAMRNERLLGQPVLTTTNGGITLYDGFHPGATGASNQSFVARMPQLREMTELQRSDYLESLGWRFIADHPGEAVRLGLVKLARTWSPIPLSAEFGRPLYRIVGLLYAVPLYALVLWGLWRPGLSRSIKLFLVAAALYYSAVHVMSVGSLRYRIPVEPLLTVVAASVVTRPSAKD